jgi:hypothetical protein
MPHRTFLISQPTWQTFCENFPDAAQWLALQLNLPLFQLPSLTPAGKPVFFGLPDGEPAYECSGTG